MTGLFRTSAALSEEQRHYHALVFRSFRGDMLVEGNWLDFPSYLAALEAMQPNQQLVAHLRMLWQQHFEAEWRRTSPALENQTRHMQTSNALSLPGQDENNPHSIAANLRTLIIPDWHDSIVASGAINRVVYSNSPHNGRYVTWLQAGSTLHIFFNALRGLASNDAKRTHEPHRTHSPPFRTGR